MYCALYLLCFIFSLGFNPSARQFLVHYNSLKEVPVRVLAEWFHARKDTLTAIKEGKVGHMFSNCVSPWFHTWSYLPQILLMWGHTCSYLSNTAHTLSYQSHTWSYLLNTCHTCPIPGHTCFNTAHTWSYLLIPLIPASYLVIPVQYYTCLPHTWSYLVMPVPYLIIQHRSRVMSQIHACTLKGTRVCMH